MKGGNFSDPSEEFNLCFCWMVCALASVALASFSNESIVDLNNSGSMDNLSLPLSL